MFDENWQVKSQKEKKTFAKFLRKKKPDRKTINLLPDLHEEAFTKIDCLY